MGSVRDKGATSEGKNPTVQGRGHFMPRAPYDAACPGALTGWNSGASGKKEVDP